MPTTVSWGILLIVCYLRFPKLQHLGATRIRKFGRRRRRRWMKRTKKDMEKLDLSPHIKPCLTYANRLYWLTLYQSTEARINPSVLLCLSIPITDYGSQYKLLWVSLMRGKKTILTTSFSVVNFQSQLQSTKTEFDYNDRSHEES